jgi:hypothetical protein
VTGVPFRAGRAWQWYAAPASAFASAADLLASAAEPRPAAPAGRIARLFVPALVLAALALGLHIVATLGTWVAQRIEVVRQEEALSAMALAAGLKNVTRDNAATALARRYASARHRAGLAAPDDAIPMLARAAPALAQLPSGTLKRATYAASIWTFELAALDDPAIDSVEQRLAAAGLPVLHARHADGVRLRVGPAP